MNESLSSPSLHPFRSLPDLVREHATVRPSDVAVVHNEQRVTWQAFDTLVNRVAAALQRDGSSPGGSIAICGANSIDYLVLLVGTLRAGMVAVPLPAQSTRQQIETMLADSDSTHFFADRLVEVDEAPVLRIALDDATSADGLRTWLAPDGARPEPVAIEPEMPCNIIYSSGTTGVPKGIVQPHRQRWGQVLRGDMAGYGPASVTMVATSLCSNTTLASLVPTLARGGRLILGTPKFDARSWLELAERERATHAMLVPVQYQRIMAVPDFESYDLTSFVAKFCTSAPFPTPLKANVLAHWPGGLIEVYGMTEGGPTCMLDARKHPDKLHSVGSPPPGVELRVIDENDNELPPGSIGEVVGRSPWMMTAYHRKPERTREVEWFDVHGNRFLRSGDVGQIDEDGFLVLLDRRKDVVISGGFNVYPSDIEAVLLEHPAVAEAAVVGIPSMKWGESPAAFVVARDNAPPATELMSWSNLRLGKTQRLADLVYLAELPRSEIGKVLKRDLRERYRARTEASSA